MSLKVIGKIYPSDVNCIKCGELIRVHNKPMEVYCICGAGYKLIKEEIVEQHIEMEYNFTNFVCIFSNYSNRCNKSCPAPNMYCKDHCNDDAIETILRDIQYSEERMVQLKKRLENLQESRKNWIISEMSGI